MFSGGVDRSFGTTRASFPTSYRGIFLINPRERCPHRSISEGSEEAMTLAELFREEGMKRGIERGMEQGMKKGIVKGMKRGIERGMERGMEKGIVKGMEQGETKALARTALKLLSKKFEIIPGELKDKILKLDSATLDIIIDGILDYKTIDDVREYLQ